MSKGKNSYLLALHQVEGLGPIRLKNLLDRFGEAQLVWEADKKELLASGLSDKIAERVLASRRKLDPDTYVESIVKNGIKWVTLFDDSYPISLKQIYAPPVVLFYKGEIGNLDHCLGVVGTRKVSSYGRVVTERFSSALAPSLVIVSGLARGVDTVAHQATIKAEGKTVAVLGGGLNKIFPSENLGLAQKIASGFGAVISEFAPDEISFPGNFPARNRIIAGLSLGVLVTEAAEESGSLITAKFALEQGKDVFAVPGPITQEGSKGTSLLIKEGARLVTEPEEVLQELGISKSSQTKQSKQNLSRDEEKILSLLNTESKHMDEITRELGFGISVTSASLIKMEIKGLVKNIGAGNYIKV